MGEKKTQQREEGKQGGCMKEGREGGKAKVAKR